VPEFRFSKYEEMRKEQGVSHVEFHEALLMSPCTIIGLYMGSGYTGHDIDGKLLLAIIGEFASDRRC
jgi:hypothetical protein